MLLFGTGSASQEAGYIFAVLLRLYDETCDLRSYPNRCVETVPPVGTYERSNQIGVEYQCSLLEAIYLPHAFVLMCQQVVYTETWTYALHIMNSSSYSINSYVRPCLSRTSSFALLEYKHQKNSTWHHRQHPHPLTSLSQASPGQASQHPAVPTPPLHSSRPLD
jgi:hypothetical protein